MMQVPVPPRSDQPPAPALHTPPSKRNAAAIASLVCAMLWPLVLVAVLLWNSRSCTTTGTTTGTTTTCTGTDTTAMSAWFSTLTGFFLIVLPPAGIISGVLGLVRSFRRPLLRRTRLLAAIGLLFGLLWLVATQFL